MNQPKHKRGNVFLNIDTGETVWLWHIQSQLTYVVSDSPDMATVYECPAHSLKAVKKIGTGLVSKPKSLTNAEKSFKAELNVFFANQTLTMPFLCDNCNKPLKAFNAFERRCCLAHIVPKSKFKTVAIHPQNLLFLCAKDGCHSTWDDSDSEHRSKMNCYKLALERFEQFKGILNQTELIRAYTYLNIKWQ